MTWCNETQLAEFAGAALARLKELADKLRSFFCDPALRYTRNAAA